MKHNGIPNLYRERCNLKKGPHVSVATEADKLVKAWNSHKLGQNGQQAQEEMLKITKHQGNTS